MKAATELQITEIDARDIPEAVRSRWGALLLRAVKLNPGRALLLEDTPYASVHAIRIQIKRLDLPLEITARKRQLYIKRLPDARDGVGGFYGRQNG